MSITDELRHSIEGAEQLYGCECKHLLALADRIDMEHERLMVERADRYSELRAKMNNCYVELPKDADGVPIHMGDKMECFTSQHRDVPKVFEVQRIIMDDVTGWRLVAYPATYVPEECRHYHVPTVEDVLLEFGEWYAHTKGGCDEDGIIAEYAAKLRLAEEDA